MIEFKNQLRNAEKQTDLACFKISNKHLADLAMELSATKIFHRVTHHNRGDQTELVTFTFANGDHLDIVYSGKQPKGYMGLTRDVTHFEVVSYKGGEIYRCGSVLDKTVLTTARRIAEEKGLK